MAKKPTIKEMHERINLITSQLNFTSRMLESIGIAFSNFVTFKGDDEEFKKYLENNKNLHKLSKEANENRKKGNMAKDNVISVEKVREKTDAKV